MKQLNLRVEDQMAEAFYRFCEKVQVKPYELLGAIVDFYARAQILSEKVERQGLDQAEALIELGRIVAGMKSFAKANGEFKLAVGDMLKPYGVTLGELGLS
jgi:hypothetical protein